MEKIARTKWLVSKYIADQLDSSSDWRSESLVSFFGNIYIFVDDQSICFWLIEWK